MKNKIKLSRSANSDPIAESSVQSDGSSRSGGDETGKSMMILEIEVLVRLNDVKYKNPLYRIEDENLVK